jgi:hypothetical protein
MSAWTRYGGSHSSTEVFCHSAPSRDNRNLTAPVEGMPVYVPIHDCIAFAFVSEYHTSSIGAWKSRSNWR